MVGANTYIGTVAEDAQTIVLGDIRRNDSLRLLWVKLILPSLMKKEFIDKVVTSDEGMCSFIVDPSITPTSSLISSDLRYIDVSHFSSHWHTAFYQNFADLTCEHTPLGMTPWQIQFEFAEQVSAVLLPVSHALGAEIEGIFKENGWKFWVTDSGFSIAPINLYDNLKAASDAFLGWMEIHAKPVRDASPQFKKVSTQSYVEVASPPPRTVTFS